MSTAALLVPTVVLASAGGADARVAITAFMLGLPVVIGMATAWRRNARRDRAEHLALGLDLDEQAPLPMAELGPLLNAMKPYPLPAASIEWTARVRGVARELWQLRVATGLAGKPRVLWSVTAVRVDGADLPAVVVGRPSMLMGHLPGQTPRQGRLARHVQVSSLRRQVGVDVERVLPGELREILMMPAPKTAWHAIRLAPNAEQWAMSGPWIVHAMPQEYRPQDRAEAVRFMLAVADRCGP